MPSSEESLSHETDNNETENLENTLLRECMAEFVAFDIQNKPVSTEKRETFQSLFRQKFSGKLWFNPLLTDISCIIQVTKNKTVKYQVKYH